MLQRKNAEKSGVFERSRAGYNLIAKSMKHISRENKKIKSTRESDLIEIIQKIIQKEEI